MPTNQIDQQPSVLSLTPSVGCKPIAISDNNVSPQHCYPFRKSFPDVLVMQPRQDGNVITRRTRQARFESVRRPRHAAGAAGLRISRPAASRAPIRQIREHAPLPGSGR